MKVFHREELVKHDLPGRVIQKAVGKDCESINKKMVMGFARNKLNRSFERNV